MTVETLFSPPHNATEAEVRTLYGYAIKNMSVDEFRAEEERENHDTRMKSIYDLYDLRKDREMMKKTLERFQDKEYAWEVSYRDCYTTAELEAMASRPT